MSDKPKDPEAERTNANAAKNNSIAAIIRALSWPGIVVGILIFFGSTLEDAVKATTKISVAGVEIEKWKSASELSEDQKKKLAELTPSEIMRFVSSYGSETRRCKGPDGMRRDEQTFLDVGLIEVKEGTCGAQNEYFHTTLIGKRLEEALSESLKVLLKEHLLDAE